MKTDMGRNKQVTCKICYKEMRSDILQRHMKVHVKVQSELAQDESKIPHNKNADANSNNMEQDKLMEESMEVWKIYKLLQRMKKVKE